MMSKLTKLVTTALVIGAAALAGCASEEPEDDASVGETKEAQQGVRCYTDGGNGRCAVRRLYCDNRPNIYVMDHDLKTRKGILKTSHSVFSCWFRKGMHAGGNDVWYWTESDVVLNGDGKGWVPASLVKTDVDPIPGLQECGYSCF